MLGKLFSTYTGRCCIHISIFCAFAKLDPIKTNQKNNKQNHLWQGRGIARPETLFQFNPTFNGSSSSWSWTKLELDPQNGVGPSKSVKKNLQGDWTPSALEHRAGKIRFKLSTFQTKIRRSLVVAVQKDQEVVPSTASAEKTGVWISEFLLSPVDPFTCMVGSQENHPLNCTWVCLGPPTRKA